MVGLYVHIPFCVRKCEYCDFVSFPGMENRFEEYINSVIREMDEYAGAEVDTVFWGGGTPSVLPAELIKKLCGAINKKFRLALDTEWTAEMNPGTLTDEKICAMLEGGINRASVGVQSFNNNELRAIGRIHDSETAYNTICRLHDNGFKNISIDLMESIPLQTSESFMNSLNTAVSLPISHISVYSLIIEDGTPLKKKYDDGVYNVPDEDEDRDLYALTGRFLKEYGYERYEISNYAKPGHESRHNIRYWQCGEYIGLGAAAHSYMSGKRYSNTTDLKKYISGEGIKENIEILTEADKMSEFMILGMRMMKGVSGNEFKRLFGKGIDDVYGDILKKYISTGFINKNGGFYRFSEKGIDVSNSILCEFI